VAKKIFCIILVLIIITSIVVNVLYFYEFYQNKKQQNLYNDWANQTRIDSIPSIPSDLPAIPVELPEVAERVAINPDYVGFLMIENSGINYPVVQLPDVRDSQNPYLNTSFEGTSLRAGTLFVSSWSANEASLDRYGPVDNTIIFGHNMGDGSMFGPLRGYANSQEFVNEHRQIIYSTKYEVCLYKVFAVYIVRDTPEIEDAYYNYFGFIRTNNVNFQPFLDGLPQRCIFFDDTVKTSKSSKFLTLSTCTGQSRDTRLVVMAVRQ